MSTRSGNGSAGSTAPMALATGTLSPVRADSSTWRSWTSTRRPSAATICPAESTSRSPTRSSRAGSSRSRPPRTTWAVGAVRLRRASSARSARKSVMNPKTTEKTTEAPMAALSP